MRELRGEREPGGGNSIMYWFPVAAIISYHKLGGLKLHKFTIIQIELLIYLFPSLTPSCNFLPEYKLHEGKGLVGLTPRRILRD